MRSCGLIAALISNTRISVSIFNIPVHYSKDYSVLVSFQYVLKRSGCLQLYTRSTESSLSSESNVLRADGASRVRERSVERSDERSHSNSNGTTISRTLFVIGNSGVAVAWALHYYLRAFTDSHVAWDEAAVRLPRPLAPVNADGAAIELRANDRCSSGQLSALDIIS